MADVEFKDLTAAEDISTNDILAGQRDLGGGLFGSRKFTFGAIGLFLNKVLQYASDLHTTSKTIIGAINEVRGAVLTGTLTAGQTTVSFTDASLVSTATVDWYVDDAFYGVVPTAYTTDWVNNTVTFTFPVQSSNMPVKVVVH